MDDIFSNPLRAINPGLFQSLQDIDLDRLVDKDLTCILPVLVKLFLNPHFTCRNVVLKLIYPYRRANDVMQLLQTKTLEPQDLNSGPASLDLVSFESGSPEHRIRLVALEFIRVQEIARQSNLNPSQNVKLQSSHLFDNPLYVEDIILCLFVLLNKTSAISVMNILDVSEALLHVKYGPTYIVHLVTNMPERCHEVCQSLITFGEHQDENEKVNEISEQRAQTLRALCQLNPSHAFTIRSLTLQLGKMPSLTIMILLDRLLRSMTVYEEILESNMNDSDGPMIDSTCDHTRLRIATAYSNLEDSFDSAISFITGILLGVDEKSRAWFAHYIKSAQQKRIDQSHHTVLSVFRSLLLKYVQKLFPCFLDTDYPTDETMTQYILDNSETTVRFHNRKLIQATATLRVYCALRGIGNLKLNNDEHDTLLRLVTCRQSVSQTSINLATVGVCTLLVCSSMINNQKDEKRAAEWLKWLIKDSHYSDNSYSNHELVHATLGLKLQAKFSVSKCKSLFVQEVFTDQMIAEHAVRVPVTKNLDNTIKEFLPIHCIHQLLESRSFSKYQVPIEEWIFRQICESSKPIHHMLPELINAYVHSIMVSTSVHGHCGTNQPIAESKILRIFSTQLYSLDSDGSRQSDKVGCEATSPIGESKKRKKFKREKQDIETTMEQCCNETSPKIDLSDNLNIVDIEVAQILLLYYLMLYEETKLKELRKIELSATDKAKLIRYNPDLMMEIPVFYILQLVRDNQDLFGTILPPMLRLIATQYPHLCSIHHWLNTTDHYEPYKSKAISKDLISRGRSRLGLQRKTPSKEKPSDTTVKVMSKQELLNQLESCFDTCDEDPLRLAKVVTSILMMPRDEVWIFVDIFIRNWTKVLYLATSHTNECMKLVRLTTRLWWKFNTVFPSKLWVMTINSLRIVQDGLRLDGIKSLDYTWDELTLDPLIVLRCDSRVFRSPAFLSILLHILDSFLAASRRCLQDQISEQVSRHKDANRDKSLEELKTTLVLAQTSAAIQILLESCLPSDHEQELLEKMDPASDKLTKAEEFVMNRFEASVSCICEHLHQVFIADTNLAKLVHFQTYPSELLATTTDKIPSMHICLDFIPELLAQPDSSKQVFVIELTSHLCEKYAIIKSLNVAKLCFNVAYTLLQLLPSDKRAQFYIPVLPALLRICKVFPILQEDARIIMNQINQISSAHIASTSSRLSLGSSRPFEGLDRMSWAEVKKLMNSLDANEALFICIQKCLLDLDLMEDKDKQQILTHNGQGKLSHPAYNTIFAYGSHVTNC